VIMVKRLMQYLAVFCLGGAAFWAVPHLAPVMEGFHRSAGHHGGDNANYEKHHENYHGEDAAVGHKHDILAMPGLQGVDTTDDEVGDLRMMFDNHADIVRTVKNTPNGIVTVTETHNGALRDAIINHVSMMISRLDDGRNPKVIIQSPTLDNLFDTHGAITTVIELTASGVAVTQTSSDPAVVANLQKHAAEVSDMTARGMQSVHERMQVSHHGTAH